MRGKRVTKPLNIMHSKVYVWPHKEHIHGRCKIFRDLYWLLLNKIMVVCFNVRREMLL
jgi:hypothetical protein